MEGLECLDLRSATAIADHFGPFVQLKVLHGDLKNPVTGSEATRFCWILNIGCLRFERNVNQGLPVG